MITMPKSDLPKSVRKHIRREKARIRRVYSDPEEVEKKIQQLYENFVGYVREQEKDQTKKEKSVNT